MKNNQRKILVADEQPVVRLGLRAIFKPYEDYAIENEVATGADLLKTVQKRDYDLILMDFRYPDLQGSKLIEQVSGLRASLPILIFSAEAEEQMILRVLQAGARGYLLKTASRDELIKAAAAVARGQSFFSPEVSSKLLNRIVKPPAQDHRRNRSPKSPITDRERQILRLICEEYTNPEIADRLNISRRTVDTHRKNLLQKIGVRNTAGLIRYAIRAGIIDG